MRFILVFVKLFFVFTVSYSQLNTKIVYLSGTGADDRVDWEFYCSKGRNSGKWTTIPVPSCWEQEGFGGYYYGYGSGDRFYENGHYRHQFQVPQDWKGNVIEIVFEGVMTDAEVKVNGKLAGPVHQGAFYRFKYDISEVLNYGGANLLEVLVKKQSDNKSVNQAERDADYWVFGGIFRPVYLEVKPRYFIDRVAVDAKADGEFKTDIFIPNLPNAGSVKVQILNSDDKEVAVFSSNELKETTRIQGYVVSPETWSSEYPRLYKAVFTLTDKAGVPIHKHTERIGFRTVEVRENDGIYINGTRVKLKGVNRHTFHPRYGRTSSKALSIETVNLIKDMNMNAVRMSHYPPDKHFLEVCDSLGLFVLNELSGWQHPPYDNEVGEKLLEEMIRRDVNHPCIVLWDNGNEGGWNTNLDEVFYKLDIQQRQVIHPWQDYGPFNTYHYMDYNYLANDGYSRRKIFMPTEFLHGLYDGGHGAGLEDYWHRMWYDPLCAGGFLWVFADEAVERTDRNNQLDTYGNEAPDGIVGPYHEKEGSYYTIREVWAPIHFEKRYITPAFNGVFRVENRFHFTDLNACKFEVEWVRFDPLTWRESVQIKQLHHFQLAPGNVGIMKLDLPQSWVNYDLLRITAYDPHGRNINSWTWPIKTAEQKAAEVIPDRKGSVPVVEEDSKEWKIRTDVFQFTFCRESGVLKSVLKGVDTIPLSNGPILIRKPKKVLQVALLNEREQVMVHTHFEDGNYFKWVVKPGGQLELSVCYEPDYLSDMTGITFSYPEEAVAGMRWCGNGPYRVYKNRMKGPQFGLWEKQYNNTVTGESGYQYPEFKGYHANTYWVQVLGKEVPSFSVYVKSNDIFLRMLTPQEPTRPEKAQMHYPPGDLSFMHTINGIGDKFMEAKRLGPQANPVIFDPARHYLGRLFLDLTFDFN